MNHLNPWEKSIHDQLAAHESTPPAAGWKKLEAALRPQPGGPIPLYRRPAFLATALSAAACLTAVVLLLPEGDPTATKLTAPLARVAAISPKSSTVSPSKAPPSEMLPSITPTANLSTPIALHPTSEALQAPSAPDASTAPANEVSTKTGVTMNTTTADSTGNGPTPPVASVRNAEHQQAVRPLRPMIHSNRPSSSTTAFEPGRHLAFSIHSGGTLSFAQRQAGYYDSRQPIVMGSNPTDTPTPEANDLDNVVCANMNRNVTSRVSHHTPFKAGLNVGIPLTDRFTLHTGLTYTRLATDIQSGSSTSYYLTEQELHYVGLPLQVSARLFRWKALEAYAIAGAELEKCVKGHRTTSYRVDDAYKSTVKDERHIEGGLWQASANVAAGLQLKLLPRMGLYFQPGLTYYFDDRSSLPHIRHDRPVQFTMEGGLRIILTNGRE